MEQMQRLLEVMARLRDPNGGCDWDLEQTFETIAPYTIEEAYEVADAIDKQDVDGIREELGDLLFQVVFQSQIASDRQMFEFDDVARTIADKMVNRHPHVFGDKKFSRQELKEHWERSKAEERASKAADSISAVDGVALALPALTRAEKIQKRASRVGFDWSTLAPVVSKVDEELAELRAAVAILEAGSAEVVQGTGAHSTALDSEVITKALDTTALDTGASNTESKGPKSSDPLPTGSGFPAINPIEDELGDLLFAVTNVARHLAVDPELALRKATAKFERRFRHVEDAVRSQGSSVELTSVQELDRLWENAKRQTSADELD